jgi:hypothetical protein
MNTYRIGYINDFLSLQQGGNVDNIFEMCFDNLIKPYIIEHKLNVLYCATFDVADIFNVESNMPTKKVSITILAAHSEPALQMYKKKMLRGLQEL